jgi:phage baseplate assembly protein gpV
MTNFFENGTRRDAGRRMSKAVEEGEFGQYQMVRAVITLVKFVAESKGLERTVVDCSLYDPTGPTTCGAILTDVPLLYPKLNRHSGEEWTPEKNDLVLIGFVDGNLRDPVVLGCLAPPANAVQAASKADAPRYHRRRNGCWETIDKDGNRQVYVAAGDSLEVVGNGTVTIGGNLSVTVAGDAVIKAAKVTLDAATVECTGDLNVAGDIMDHVGSGGRSMASMRTIYNGHEHPENDDGGTTDGPNQQM